jgi:hypothetical protein
MKKLLLTLCLVSSVSLASDNLFSGLYMGINAGQTFNKFSDLIDSQINIPGKDGYIYDTLTGYNYDTHRWVGNLELGYKFNQYFGIEANWLVDPKNIDIQYSVINMDSHKSYNNYDVNFKQQILSAALTATYPIKNFLFTGKAGIAGIFNANASVTKNNSEYSFKDDIFKTQSTLMAGADIGYKITEHFIADVDYLHYFKRDTFDGLNYVGIGLQYVL